MVPKCPTPVDTKKGEPGEACIGVSNAKETLGRVRKQYVKNLLDMVLARRISDSTVMVPKMAAKGRRTTEDVGAASHLDTKLMSAKFGSKTV